VLVGGGGRLGRGFGGNGGGHLGFVVLWWRWSGRGLLLSWLVRWLGGCSGVWAVVLLLVGLTVVSIAAVG